MRVSDQNIDRIYISQMTRPSTYHMVENHYHYYYEIYYVRQGTCRFFVHNSLYDLRQGDFLIIPPMEVHFNRYLSTCTRVNIWFKESDLRGVGGAAFFMPGFAERFLRLVRVHLPSAYHDLFKGTIDTMLQEEKIDDDSTKPMLEALLRVFFINSSRHGIFHYENTNLPSNDSDEGILTAARYMADHYNSPISLPAMAKIASLSPSYFSRRFRETTGMGMKEYLSYIRLNHAATELLSTGHTITEVAMNCGFSDSNYFKDAFRRQYGVSPRAYRNARKTNQTMENGFHALPPG